MSNKTINLNFGGLGTIQIVLIIIHYSGFAILPIWLLFLPLIIISTFLIILIIIVGIIILLEVLG